MFAAEVVERFRDRQRAFYAGGALEPLEDLLHPDAQWHVPGDNAISGDYRGRPMVLDYFVRRRSLANATMRITIHDRLVDPEAVVELADGEATFGEEHVTWRTVGLYRIVGEQVAEGWLVPFDLDHFNQVWRRR